MKTIAILFSILILILTDIIVPILIVRANNAKFSKDSLHSEEEMLSIASTHWFVTLKIVVLQLLITTLCVLFISYSDYLEASSSLSILMIALILFLLTRLHISVLQKCREFVVTNKRIIIKYGIVSRDTKEYRYEKIESCDVNQNVIGRIFQYGSIIILGVGGSNNKEHFIKDPFVFRQYIIDRIDCDKETTVPLKESSSGNNQMNSITELKEYKKLLDEGVLTQEEFDKKKQEILERK